MNRKLLSLVLAAVFTVSLGTNGFSAYDKYSNSYNSSYGTRNSNVYTVSVASGEDNVDRTSEQRTGFQIEIPDANTTLGGNLTAVFKYNGGTLIGVEQADGTFQLYDSYGARFTVNNAGGIWTVTNVSLRTSDLAEMEAAGSAEDFFRSMGFTNSFLGIADMNDTTTETRYNADSEQNETVVTEVTGKSSKIGSGWWQLAKDTLKQGANFSLSISEGTGATGPTLTILENGKQMASYTTDNTVEGVTNSPFGNGSYSGLRQTANYYYDSHGFMTGYSQATMEDTETDNGTVSGKWIQNVTKITYDKDGVRTDSTYKLFDWANDPMGTVNNSNSDIALGGAEVTASTIGQEISKTYYSANNSALYSYDFTNNNVTYFANNKQSFVRNETGTTVGLYEYSANGVIQAYFNANGTVEGSDEKVGTTTIFDRWGRQLYTATGGGLDDPTGKNAFTNKTYRNELTSQYYDIVLGNIDNKTLAADFTYNSSTGTFDANPGTGTAISSLNIYTDQVFKGNDYRTNGFLDMNKVWNAMNGISNNSFTNEKLNEVAVGTESVVVTMSGYLDTLNAAADNIESSGTNSTGATDEADMTTIANALANADSTVAAAKAALDGEIAKGANADKSKVEKLASIYAAACQTASEMYDRAESIAGIAAFRQKKNNASKKGSLTVSDATLQKFGSFSIASNGNVTNSGNNSITKRREAASQKALDAFSYAQNAYSKRSGNNASVLANNLKGLNTGLYNLGYTASDIYKMLKYSHGGKTALASTTIAVGTWDGDNIPSNADTSDVSYQSNSTQNITGSTQDTHVQWSTQSKSSNSSVAAAGLTFTNTIMFGGAQAYQTEKNIVTNIYEAITETVSTESDPAVAGTYLGTTVIDGRTYAMVGNAEINIMDGEDFHALGDEVIYIDITGKEDTVKDAKKGDNVMFMGDVSKNKADGHFVVTMKEEYGKGYMNFGSNSDSVAKMDEAKNKITEIAKVAASGDRATADALYQQAVDEGILSDSGYNWIANNTETNVDKLAAGNFTWDNKNDAGSIQKNLEEAWKLLF